MEMDVKLLNPVPPELQHYERAGAIRLTVTDTGSGLSPDQLQLLCTMEEFSPEVLQAGQLGGLGLLISKEIVRRHGGVLAAYSEGIGKGSIFVVVLPVYIIPTSTVIVIEDSVVETVDIENHESIPRNINRNNWDENSAEDVKMSVCNSTIRPKLILVVDDAKSNRKMLIRILEAKGFECIEAVNGQDAIDSYMNSKVDQSVADNVMAYDDYMSDYADDYMKETNRPIDGILMDFEMPIMNGPTAVKELRKLGCNCVIVGISGNVLKSDVDYFKSCGADAVLPKPFDVNQLMQILEASVSIASSTNGHGIIAEDSVDSGNANSVRSGEKTSLFPLDLHHLSSKVNNVLQPFKALSKRMHINNSIAPVSE